MWKNLDLTVLCVQGFGCRVDTGTVKNDAATMVRTSVTACFAVELGSLFVHSNWAKVLKSNLGRHSRNATTVRTSVTACFAVYGLYMVLYGLRVRFWG